MSYAIPFSGIYTTLLEWLLSDACPAQTNARTGRQIRVGRGGTSFRLDLSDCVLPVVGSRKLFPKSAAAEVAWYLSGSQDVTWIQKHAPIWDKFVESDGKTILAAYGYRWRKHFGRDQLLEGVNALGNDPSDRRVYISAWDPATDGLGRGGQKNVPCPTSFTLSVLDGELHSTLFLRSSDAFVGLPYDVMGHALLMDAIASALGLTPGVAQFALAHPHLYEDHWDMARTCVMIERCGPEVPRIEMPGSDIRAITKAPDAYVALMANRAGEVAWPAFNPKPFVVE